MTLKEKEQLIKELKAHGKKVAASKELSEKELRGAGIITKRGQLTKPYK